MIKIPTKKRQQVVLVYSDLENLVAMHYRADGQRVICQKSAELRLEESPDKLSTDALAGAVASLMEKLNAQCHEVCLILGSDRVFSFQLELPELSREDQDSFIELEAEQRLPYPASEVFLSRLEGGRGTQGQTLIMALRKSRIQPLVQALKTGGYRVTNVTIDIAGAIDPELTRKPGECLLIRSAANLTLAIQSGGAIIGLRHFPVAAGALDHSTLVRDIRISIAQLPAETQAGMERIRAIMLPVVDGGRLGNAPIEGIDACGLKYAGEDPAGELFDAIAEDLLSRNQPRIEFLPPKPNRLEKIIQRFDSRRTFWISSAAAAVVIITGAAFFLQHRQLSALEKKWSGISGKVGELEKIQGQIREFRGWFSLDFASLTTMKAVFEAFPETGEIWLKNFIIRDGNLVRCSGSAQYQSALLGLMDKLRSTPGIQNMELQQQQGNNPIFFAIEFTWTPGAEPVSAGESATPENTESAPTLSANSSNEN